MPEVKVIDLAHVTVDGVVAGSVVDVLDNYRPVEGIKDLLFAAIRRWSDDREQAHEAAVALLHECHCKTCDTLKAAHATALQDAHGKHGAALDEAAQAHASNLQAATDNHAKAMASLKEQLQADHRSEADGLRSQIAELRKVIDEQKTLVDALGGTELGQQMAREKRCRELREAITRLQAEHDAMVEPEGA
jgi:acetyl/propionyl-CoA carboxylase alpha subunit